MIKYSKKIERGFNIIKNWLKMKIDSELCKPTSCSLVLTHRCPLRCKMCNFWRTPKQDPTTEELLSWIMDLYSFGIKNFVFTGGEPLLRDDLFILAKKIKKMGCGLTMITNGFFINSENSKEMGRYFDLVVISIDGAKAETHDKIRGVGGSFLKAINAIKLLKKYNVNLRINFTIQKDNFYEIIDAMNLAEKLKTKILFQFVEISGFGNYQNSDLQKVNIDELKYQFEKIKNNKYLVNSFDYFNLVLDTLRKQRKEIKCFAPHMGILIDSDGSVYPCPDLKIVMGNIKTQKIKDIYFSEKFIKLRKLIERLQIKKCRICLQACEIEASLDFNILHVFKKYYSRLKV